MTYSVKLYKNTGFNTSNIPDSPARLGSPFIEKTAIDLIQNRVVSNVKIKVSSFDEIKDVDYCKIGDFYYIVNNIMMEARDTANLYLTPDFITSMGGVNNIEFLDGITSRHHVSEDEYGKYREEDPLLVCKEPLKLEYAEKLFNVNSSEYETYTIVISTADLEAMGETDSTFKSITYTDDNGNSVTVPHLEPSNGITKYIIEKEGFLGSEYFSVDGVSAFIINKDGISNPKIIRAIQYCRDIAAESCIIAQYAIPKEFLYIEETPEGTGGSIDVPAETKITGMIDSRDSGINTIFNDTVKNKRVLYGDLCKVGIIATNGNKTEFVPERVVKKGQDDNYHINIACVVDPRQDGAPYFRFQTIDGYDSLGEPGPGASGNNLFSVKQAFWVGAMPGEKWYQVPLIFTSASGKQISEKYYNQQYSIREFMNNKSEAMIAANTLSATGNAILSAGSAASTPLSYGTATGAQMFPSTAGTSFGDTKFGTFSVPHTDMGQFSSGAMGAVMNPFLGAAKQTIREEQYNYNVGKNLYNLGLSQSVVVPNIQLPQSDGTIRDFFGNGVIPYRYRPSDTDLMIQDKLLTMYGYKITEPLKTEFFNNRLYFNYIEMTSVSIGGDIPQWYKEGIKAQLGNGIRIWHTKPDESYYTNNPIA